MEKSTILALSYFLIWLIIFSQELIRWRKEKAEYKVLKGENLPWLTFLLVALSVSLFDEIEFIRYSSILVGNAVAQFFLEALLIGLVALSPQILILLFKKISRSFN